MQLFQRLISIITVSTIILGAGIISAEAFGIIYKWQPFVFNADLKLDRPSKALLPKRLSVAKELLGQFDDNKDPWHKDLIMMNNNIYNKTTNKSLSGKIRITVSRTNSFMISQDDQYPRGKGGNVSEFTGTLPAFFQNPSQEAALKTLKLIEPRVNLELEF
jgi:hypothetical protein